MDVNGPIDACKHINVSWDARSNPAGKQGENLKLEIKIDTMAQNIESPQGSSGGPINDVKGKVI